MIVARPRSDGAIATAVCTAAEVVGDLVYISGAKVGADYSVRTADNTLTAKMPAIGVIVAKISSTRALIQLQGETTLFTGLTPGTVYWVGDTGQPTSTPPSPTGPGARKYWQSIGVATDSGRIRLDFTKVLRTRVG